MHQADRIKIIKKLLAQKEHLSTREIMKKLDVSFDTARRDIIRLTETGQASRVHGGIIALDRTNVPGFKSRTYIESPIKNKMASIMAHYIYPQRLYFFGSSTTIARACEKIKGVNATIVTHSIDNAANLLQSELPDVQLLGGKINKENHFTYSMESLAKIKNYRFSMAFIGSCVVANGQIYEVNEEDAAIDRCALAQARQAVLVTENYKFHSDRSSFYQVTSAKNIDLLITDQPLDEKTRKIFKSDCLIKYALK